MLQKLRGSKDVYLQVLPVLLIALLLVLILILRNSFDATLPDKLQDFVTLSLSIFIEAFPFLVLGSLLAAVVNTYMSHALIHRLLPKNKWLRRATLSMTGFIFPVCECGNVPLSRALMIQGLKPSEAITFLLAAPVINPITIWATAVAFQFDNTVVIARVAATFIIANFIGFIISQAKSESEFLTNDFSAVCDTHENHAKPSKNKKPNNFSKFTDLFQHEAFTMLRMLAFGALVAGFIQVAIPRDVITSIGSNVVLSIVVMLILAFVVSICANVDAFFALSFAGTFTIGSIVSFLVFGPMVDIKMLALLKTTFKPKLLVLISVLSLLLSALAGVIVTYVA